jgi:tRNA G10  N-methylase Trm11
MIKGLGMLKKLEFQSPTDTLRNILSKSMIKSLFPDSFELVPQLNEVYELELAFYESQTLSDEELLRNGAYFASINGQPTRHFLMCQGEPLRLAEHSSSRLKSFFKTNQFKTGYATNGLFPYRGKFHPQMIKGLINVIGCKRGDVVLDPMMGSGTVLIEATLMGIDSIGIDASPFCSFMTKAKLDGLKVPVNNLKAALINFDSTFNYFLQKVDELEIFRHKKQTELFGTKNTKAEPKLPYGCKRQDILDFLMLAFLDAKGYAERSKRKTLRKQFHAILERYIFAAEKIQTVLNGFQDELGTSDPRTGDARQMNIADESIDGIIFSPPYSFAIDYLENDAYHLNAIGVDINELRKSMVGLRHKKPIEKYKGYLKDMAKVISECARVLKPGKICSIVVGTNNNQISKILKVSPEEVTGIHEQLTNMGENYGMQHVKSIERQITGMANTMRSEFIVMLQKS